MGYTAMKTSSDSASLSAEVDGDAAKGALSSLISVDDNSLDERLRAFVVIGRAGALAAVQRALRIYHHIISYHIISYHII
eukprot:2095658-Heterocapsa_arctica.AAC.1